MPVTTYNIIPYTCRRRSTTLVQRWINDKRRRTGAAVWVKCKNGYVIVPTKINKVGANW